MVNFMRPADPGQVAVITFKSFKAVMDKPVVKNEIDDPVNTYSRAYPKSVIQTQMSNPHQPQSKGREAYTEQVVQFKPAVPLLMVCFVDKPQRAVEKVFVHSPGYEFH
jgi:hypothetical protein